MTLATLVLLAFGLAMDAFAVSVSNAMCYSGLGGRRMLANSACFGVFQGVMPTLGFFGGALLSGYIEAVDHWVALALLGFIGGKMLAEGIKALRAGDGCPVERPVYTTKTMLVQALATSIDALAVGISFAALDVNIGLAASAIAAITFVCCVAGGLLGRRFGAILGDWAQVVGGVILAGIGLRIFIEHMLEQAAGAA